MEQFVQYGQNLSLNKQKKLTSIISSKWRIDSVDVKSKTSI